eukprot:743558-Pelagomonas_calceolata.AAC.1
MAIVMAKLHCQNSNGELYKDHRILTSCERTSEMKNGIKCVLRSSLSNCSIARLVEERVARKGVSRARTACPGLPSS